jgi:hypothetical protein
MSERHGSPYDRGWVDSYYQRDANPHYYSTTNKRVEEAEMTPAEIEEYYRGYNDNQGTGDFERYDLDY